MSNQNIKINKLAATVFGTVFLLVGVLGFVPPLAPNGLLLGLFAVNAMHNLVHLATGVGLLVFANLEEGRMARIGLLVFGSVYGLVMVLGFVAADLVNALGVAVNGADNFLHLLLTVALLGVPLAFNHGKGAGHPVAP